MGFKAVFHKIKENLPFWNEKLPEIPDLVYDYLKIMESSTVHTSWRFNHSKLVKNNQ